MTSRPALAITRTTPAYFKRVAEKAIRASVVIYSVDTQGPRFEQNSNFFFACVIYNAGRDTGKPLPNLVMETRLVRDGNPVYSGQEIPIQIANQPDRTRVIAQGVVPLKDLEPGSYYLQVAIIDRSAKKKTAAVVQWVDFEIVGNQAQ